MLTSLEGAWTEVYIHCLFNIEILQLASAVLPFFGMA